jgi:glucose-6-phosphate isomerase, archaeal
MLNVPNSFELKFPYGAPSHYDNHIVRKLSFLKGIFLDQNAFQQKLAEDDSILYEVYELVRPEIPGELRSGISIVHPGKVGPEFFMTKGHFHRVLDTGEIYYCLQGSGMMVMETPQGDWSVEELCSGRVLYVPPGWAHRSVNTGAAADLITFFVYPSHAGHDYRTIEVQGFRKLVIEDQGRINVIDNPRWQAPGDRSQGES